MHHSRYFGAHNHVRTGRVGIVGGFVQRGAECFIGAFPAARCVADTIFINTLRFLAGTTRSAPIGRSLGMSCGVPQSFLVWRWRWCPHGAGYCGTTNQGEREYGELHLAGRVNLSQDTRRHSHDVP
jgi:hypothetical protein